MPPEGISAPTTSLADAAGTTDQGSGAQQQTADAFAAAGKWLDGDRPGKRSERKGGHERPRSDEAPAPRRIRGKAGRVHLEDEGLANSIESKLAGKRGQDTVEADEEEDEQPQERARDRRAARPTKPSLGSDGADDEDEIDDEDEDVEIDDEDDEEEADEEDDDADSDLDEEMKAFGERMGIKNPRNVRAAQQSVLDDILRAVGMAPGAANQQKNEQPRNDGSAGKSAPQGSDDTLLDEEGFKEIEEWSPAVAKAVRGLTKTVQTMHQQFAAQAQRQAATQINKFIDGKAAAGYAKQYGQGRSVTAQQRAVRNVLIQAAVAYQAAKRAEGVDIDDDDALEAAHLLINKDRMLKDARRSGRQDVERAVRRRHRNVDLVPGAGSTSRGKSESDEGSDKNILRLAGRWIDQKSKGRRVA